MMSGGATATSSTISGSTASGHDSNLTTAATQQQQLGNSLAIRQEIQRFESVHPEIYSVYDLLDLVAEPLAQQIREHVICIEGTYILICNVRVLSEQACF